MRRFIRLLALAGLLTLPNLTSAQLTLKQGDSLYVPLDINNIVFDGTYIYAACRDKYYRSYELNPSTGEVTELSKFYGDAIQQSLRLEDSLLMATDFPFFLTFDVSSPSSPVLLGSEQISGFPEDIETRPSISLAAVASQICFSLIDYSDPSNLNFLSETPALEGITQIEIAYDRVYVAERGDSLYAYDISTPTAPVLIEGSGYRMPGLSTEDLYAIGTVLYASFGTEGVHIIDYTDDLNPTLLCNTDDIISMDAGDLERYGDTLFVAGGDKIVSFDISDPSNPTVLAVVEPPAETNYVSHVPGYTIGVSSNYGLTSYHSVDLSLFNKNHFAMVNNSAYVTGDNLIVTGPHGGAAIFQIQPDGNLSPLSKITTESSEPVEHALVDGNTLFLPVSLNAADSLMIYDITDISNPQLLSQVKADVGPLVMTGDTLIVGSDSIYFYDVGDLANPLLLGVYGDSYETRSMLMYNGYLLLCRSYYSTATEHTGVGLYDLSDLESLTPVWHNPYHSFYASALRGDKLYASLESGLVTFDLSDLSSSAWIDGQSTSRRIVSIVQEDGYLFCYGGGISLYGVHGSVIPTLLEEYDHNFFRGIDAGRWHDEIFCPIQESLIHYSIQPTPPYPVYLQTPENGSIIERLDTLLTWSSSDDINWNDTVRYDLLLSHSPYGEEAVDFELSNLVASTETEYLLDSLENHSTYWWKVRAYAGDDTFTVNNPFSVSPLILQPFAFNQLAPADSSLMVEDTVTVNWSRAAVDSFVDLLYTVELSTFSDFHDSTVVMTADTFVLLTDLSAQTGTELASLIQSGRSLDALPQQDTLYWRVRAADQFDRLVWSENDSTEGRCFVVDVPEAPQPFTLLEPVDTFALQVDAFPLIFRWHASSDPDYGEEIRYTLALSNDEFASDTTTVAAGLDTFATVDDLAIDTYQWYVIATDHLGLQALSERRTLQVTSSVGDPTYSLPTEFSLGEAWPNPFNPSTNITLALPRSAPVFASVYNSLGQRVSVLASGERMAQGWNVLEFNAAELSSGIYFLRVEVPGELHEMRRMVLVR